MDDIIRKKSWRYYQEIYDETGKLVEIHHKYPEDLGHQKIKSE